MNEYIQASRELLAEQYESPPPMTEADYTLDEMANRIGCDNSELMWDPSQDDGDGLLWLLLPNCSIIEIDPGIIIDADNAIARWEAYNNTAADMSVGDRPDPFLALYHPADRPSLVFAVTARIQANLSDYGRHDSANAVY